MESKTGNIYPPKGTTIDPHRRRRIDQKRKANTLILKLRGIVKIK